MPEHYLDENNDSYGSSGSTYQPGMYQSSDYSFGANPSAGGKIGGQTNQILREISKQGVDQKTQLGFLLDAERERNVKFDQLLTDQQTKMGALFDQITQATIDRGTVSDTEAERANKAARDLTARTLSANTGINPNLGLGFSRGRATTTTGLSNAPKATGSSRRESFQATRPE